MTHSVFTFVTLIIFLLDSSFVFSNEGDSSLEIVWATPEWKTYTNRDGKGLYNELMSTIFGQYNIKIVRQYVPWKRALHHVRISQADVTGGGHPSPLFVSSNHPVMLSMQSIFFRKTTFTNWQGIESLYHKKLTGVQALGYILDSSLQKSNIRMTSVQKRENALKMVASGGRVDFYIDNRYQMELTIKSMTPSINMDNFQIEDVGSIKIYMLFSKTDRGIKLRTLYDKEVMRLHKSGALRSLYKKYNRDYPLEK